MTAAILRGVAQARAAGTPFGITSVCSAHPLVIVVAREIWTGRLSGFPA